MTKTLKKIGVAVATIGSLALPFATKAQSGTLPPGLGISYATAIGLGTKDVRTTISQIINVALSLVGIVIVVIVIYGGFLWMTAGGDSDKTDTAKKWIFSGIIGLAIILSAYAIAQFVISNLVTATT